MPVIKGNLKLDIDELGLEARVSIVPDPAGAEVSPDLVRALLRQKGVTQGIESGEVDKAFRTLERKGEALSFAVAHGTPAIDAQPESLVLEPFFLPEELKGAADDALKKAPAPEARPVDPRAPKDPISVDPAVLEVGYVRKDALVGRVSPPSSGKLGRSIYGKPIPPKREHHAGLLMGANLRIQGKEALATASGFLRRGANWCDLVPYQRTEFSLSVDRGTCYLTFTPGHDRATVNAAEVIAEAEKIDIPRSTLLSEAEISGMLKKAAASGTPLEKVPITAAVDASVSVTVSPDKLRATLTLRKGKGTGRKLELAAVSDAIRKSGVKGFNAEIVRKDILGFYNNGGQTILDDYTLAVGAPAEKGQDGKLEWLAGMLSGEDAERVRRASTENVPVDVKSLGELPLEIVESVGRVTDGQEILRITEAAQGKPGLDVFKTGIPGIKGAEPKYRIFENLKRKKDIVVSAIDGIVEKAVKDGVLLVRVRLHQDAIVEVTASKDRMQAFLSYHPPLGSGKNIQADELAPFIEKEGIVGGVKNEAVLEALNRISRRQPFNAFLIAEGKKPKGAERRNVAFHVQLATGKRVQVRDDGHADFKDQDTITQVSKGAHLATLPPPGAPDEDGFDVMGEVLAPQSPEEQLPQPGRNVRVQERDDGGSDFYAEESGELVFQNNVLEVKQSHTVAGNVDLASGNVKFKGAVHVRGSVLSGFTVVAGDDVVVDEVIQAAFVSSDGSIHIGQGIKGDNRGILRARRDIKAAFAEQAILLSMGDVRIRTGCIHCQIKCNGRLVLEGEKGNLMGGVARAKLGASVQNLGSPGGARTELSFGQDYVVKDQLDKEQKSVDTLKHRILELEARLKHCERTYDRQGLEAARREKLAALKELEGRSLRLLGLRDRYEEHFSAEVVVRGTMYPGAVVESHGRLFEVKQEKKRIALYFDANQGRILEKPAK